MTVIGEKLHTRDDQWALQLALHGVDPTFLASDKAGGLLRWAGFLLVGVGKLLSYALFALCVAPFLAAHTVIVDGLERWRANWPSWRAPLNGRMPRC